MKKRWLLYGWFFATTSLLAQVGIGTTTPTHKLDVAGEARIRTLNPRTPPTRLVGADAQGVLGEIRGQNTGDMLQWDANLNQWVIAGSGPNNAWLITGNANTNPNTNFLGTTDAAALVIRTNNTERIRVLSTGEVGIGTSTPSKQVHIQGGNNGGLQVNVLANGAANLSANLLSSALNNAGQTAHGLEVNTLGSANFLIGVGSTAIPDHSGTNIAVRGVSGNSTGRSIGTWGAIGDAATYISTTSNTFSAGGFFYHQNALLPAGGAIGTPTAIPAAEQRFALAAKGHIYQEDGHIVSSGSVYTPFATPPPHPSIPGIPRGAGTRLLWLPERSAWRAVGVYARPDDPFSPNQSDHADPEQIGYASFAAGLNVRGSGALTFVVGVSSQATATGAVALGKYVSTTHPGSFQIGDDPGPLSSRPSSPLRSVLSNQFSTRYYNGYRFLTREASIGQWAANPFPTPDPTISPANFPNRVPGGVFIAGMYNHFRLGSIQYGLGEGWLGIGTQMPDAPLHILTSADIGWPRAILVSDGWIAVGKSNPGTFPSIAPGLGNRGIYVDEGYIEIAGPTGAFRANGQNGITQVVNVMGSNGQPCQLNFVKGILVGTTCP
ncbi:MAG: hypothetical protein NZZ60_01740 [Bacteroidia bacterium]|nr:hypothetical protein [Bacteroidia bacterium]MCX7651430.1 hypothetical protein [Bacteroidia bacterium]MDW8417065.1 hypothetical protein [Bacteroidia bacterium]